MLRYLIEIYDRILSELYIRPKYAMVLEQSLAPYGIVAFWYIEGWRYNNVMTNKMRYKAHKYSYAECLKLTLILQRGENHFTVSFSRLKFTTF